MANCGWPNFTPLTHVWVRARETQAAMEMLQCNGGIEAARTHTHTHTHTHTVRWSSTVTLCVYLRLRLASGPPKGLSTSCAVAACGCAKACVSGAPRLFTVTKTLFYNSAAVLGVNAAPQLHCIAMAASGITPSLRRPLLICSGATRLRRPRISCLRRSAAR
eukprot:scaffold20409_cov88-Phaeocystis_antarctica.AAC.1